MSEKNNNSEKKTNTEKNNQNVEIKVRLFSPAVALIFLRISPYRAGDRILLADDSNDDWWKVGRKSKLHFPNGRSDIFNSLFVSKINTDKLYNKGEIELKILQDSLNTSEMN